jgi:geranylgeranyl diphosphate synthase type II
MTFWQNAHSLLEENLHRLLPHGGPLFDAARYSLFSGGKRIRPLLLLACLETYSCPLEKGMNIASALECIHTYSLIHDDLPCMDNDDLRRGKPTLHRVYPEWHALLTGDYLLTLAFEVLAHCPYLCPVEKIDIMQILSQRSGAHGMIGGQMLDLKGDISSPSELETLHAYKTAALFSCALESAAILSGASTNDRVLLKDCGTKLGIAFQVHDDLQDAAQDEKTSAVSLLGASGAESYKQSLLAEGHKILNTLSRPAPLLHAFLTNTFTI